MAKSPKSSKGSSSSGSASKTPILSTMLSVNKDGKLTIYKPSLSNSSSTMSQVALVSALSVPLNVPLTADDEMKLKANLGTLSAKMSSKGISDFKVAGPSAQGSSAELVHHAFDGAVDVMVHYDPGASNVNVGISAHKVVNKTQFDLAISKSIIGQTASESSTLTVVLPASSGSVGVNLNVQHQLGQQPVGSAGLTWKWP